MTATGVLLWFDNYFTEEWHLPKGVLDIMLVVHYYEAWLATLAIALWHGYHTVFSPHVYPMNPAWIDGRMPKTMYTHEHPEGPNLKGRVHRYIYEEGKLVTPSFSEYLIPTSMDMPRVESIILESRSGVGPFGAKGIGEPALTPVAPAIANAVADAIGVRVPDLPITPEKIVKALAETGR